jgi:uncharacterized protein YndB with AHSA1/START domain
MANLGCHIVVVHHIYFSVGEGRDVEEQHQPSPALSDVSKTVTVDVPVHEAFTILIEDVGQWTPPGHTFLKNPEIIAIEPRVGGRFYERAADGTEAVHGVITEIEPPRRMVMTWRVGANWQPILDDEKASLIEFAFTEAAPGRTTVVLTHSQFHRHGEAAAQIHAAVDGPSPGDTLGRYAEAVARRIAAPPRSLLTRQ